VLVLATALAAAGAFVQCDGPGPGALPADGGDGDAGDAASDAFLFSDTPSMGFADSAPQQPPLDAGDPPARACGEIADAASDQDAATSQDAGDGAVCPLPASVCADHYWLVYYTGGDCVGGACRWQKSFLLCPAICIGGQCQVLGTK
jgi:hypothetical protein